MVSLSQKEIVRLVIQIAFIADQRPRIRRVDEAVGSGAGHWRVARRRSVETVAPRLRGPSVDHWIFVDGPLQGEIIDALSWVGSDSKQISISCAVLDAPSF